MGYLDGTLGRDIEIFLGHCPVPALLPDTLNVATQNIRGGLSHLTKQLAILEYVSCTEEIYRFRNTNASYVHF